MPQGKRKPRTRNTSTSQQLRSFAEVARLESFTAAAESLDLSPPTVWHQVKLLEDEFGEQLLAREGRGVRLTEAGKMLARLAQPLVCEISDLKQRFQEQWRGRKTRINIAASPRIFQEDVPPCLETYRRTHSDVMVTISERLPAQIGSLVANRRSDLGLLVAHENPTRALGGPLECRAIYPLQVRLVLSRNHSLARRRNLTLAHVRHLPFFSSIDDAELPGIHAALDRAGVTEAPIFAKVYFSSTVRKYVLQEEGAGILLAPPSSRPDAELIETPLDGLIAPPFAYSVRRTVRGTGADSAANLRVDDFVASMARIHSPAK